MMMSETAGAAPSEPTADPDGAPATRCRGVRYRWRDGFTLTAPDLVVRRAEQIAVTGPSGSGKSTLLGLLAGAIAPDAGSIDALGRDFSAMRPAARDRFRADHVGVVFQLFNLLPYASVEENVLLPLAFSARRRARAPDGRAEAARLLGALGLPARVVRTPVSALSVGQAQRVAAARALIGRPEILLADEPTSALDAAARDAFLDLLAAEARAAGAAVIVVTHDEAVAERFPRRVTLSEPEDAAGVVGA